MANGYMGTILWVDLSTGAISHEVLDPEMARDFVGGYGIGARLLYERMRPGTDPLGPDNILGFVYWTHDGYAGHRRQPLTGRMQVAADRRLG